MWELNEPKPVKFIAGIIAASEDACEKAVTALAERFGEIDLVSQIWSFAHTNYYKDEIGDDPVKQFVTFEKLIMPDGIAEIKHVTNEMEKEFADSLDLGLARPVNIDPGYVELSKLVLATTKNFSHRIYIGQNMWAEVTLVYVRGKWHGFEFTFPDYKAETYHGFLSQVREKLYEQLKIENLDTGFLPSQE